MKKRKDHGGSGEESNNLMWLLDFKLDFFNEAEASNKDKGQCFFMFPQCENLRILREIDFVDFLSLKTGIQ